MELNHVNEKNQYFLPVRQRKPRVRLEMQSVSPRSFVNVDKYIIEFNAL